MKRVKVTIGAGLLLGVAAMAFVALVDVAIPNVFVDAAAPHGGDGSRKRPFRSPVEAVEAIRRLKTERAFVLLKPGTYDLPDGLVLGPDDSGLRFVSFGEGSSVRLTRSIAAIPGTKVACAADEMPDSEYPGFMRGKSVRPHAPMFFYDHMFAEPARWPNEGWAYFTKTVDNGLRSRVHSGILPDAPAVAGSFVFESDRPGRWNFDEGVWLAGYWTHDWSFERLRAARFDPTNRVMYLKGAALYGLASGTWSSEKGRRFYACNVRAELDAPGEYYWDRKTGVVDFIPPKDGVKEFRAAVSEGPIVSVTGARDIVFSGLVFEYSAGDGVAMNGATNCLLSGCRVTNVGGTGVVIDGGSGCGVRDTEIVGCGCSGVLVRGGNRRELVRADHSVERCRIHDFGRICRTYAPGASVDGVGVTLSGNVFFDAPHAAVIYRGNEHLFESNEVCGIMRETGDTGAFYTGRDPLSRGNVLRFNYVHDLGRPGDSAENTMAFYLDDCDAGDTLVSNRVKNVARGLMLGGGHDNHILGNVFENCALGMSVDARGVVWNERWDSPIDKSWQMTRKVKEMDVNREPWRSKYPLLVTYLEDGPREPRHIEVRDNAFIGCKRAIRYEMGAENYKANFGLRGNTVDGKPMDE